MRHYLTQPLSAELIYGFRRVNIETGQIDNISKGGLGIQLRRPLPALQSGTPVTVAMAREDSVWTMTGKVASILGGSQIGVKVADDEHPPFPDLLGTLAQACVTVSPPRNGKASVIGNFSMSARHPIQWAVSGGALVLDLAQVTSIDSAGIGLLLLLSERNGVRIERCAPLVCRTIKLCKVPGLCVTDCSEAGAVLRPH